MVCYSVAKDTVRPQLKKRMCPTKPIRTHYISSICEEYQCKPCVVQRYVPLVRYVLVTPYNGDPINEGLDL
jgi:hypothetical protein